MDSRRKERLSRKEHLHSATSSMRISAAFLQSIFLLLISAVIPSLGDKEAKQCGLKVPPTVTTRPSKFVIAHRGASFHLPEHTLPAYRLALELGADYIETDLVSSKDGHLVAIHNVDLSETTNVEAVFQGRESVSKHTNKTGYWVFDFTLEELKKLKVKQRLPESRSRAFDLKFDIPTLDEILELLHHWNDQLSKEFTTKEKKRAGLYAELKDPKVLDVETGHDMVDTFLDQLENSKHAHDLGIFNDTECAALKFDEYLVPPLIIECFDGEVLKSVHEKWRKRYNTELVPPLVLLAGVSECLEEDWWFHVGEWRGFLGGIGPDKACLEDHGKRSFMERVLEHKLVVHPWTQRPEKSFVSNHYENELQETIDLFCHSKVDGIFTEDVTTAKIALLTDCEGVTKGPTPSPSSQCADAADKAEEEDTTMVIGLAAGVMGVLVGSIVSLWLSQSRFCMSRRHRRTQLQIPTHEDVEMI